MTSPLEGLVRCAKHQCPYIEVDGEYSYCLLEYIDEMLGKAKITGIENDPLCIEFDSGYRIPLICPDCGAAHVHVKERGREMLIGKYLVSLSYHPEEEDLPEAVTLHFSDGPDNPPIEGLYISLHLDSARQIKKNAEAEDIS